jgi:hypothetical protein
LKRKTLLANVPINVQGVSGKTELLGFSMKDAHKFVVQEVKRLPFSSAETMIFDISIGENGKIEVNCGTIQLS